MVGLLLLDGDQTTLAGTLKQSLCLNQLLHAVDVAGLRQAIQDTMDDIKGEFEVKADSIVMLRRNIEGDIDAIDKKVDRLNELKRIKKNTVGQISDLPAPEYGSR